MIEFVFATALLLPEETAKAKASPARVIPAVETVRSETTSRQLMTVAVTLECTARASGRVENCRVLGETHPGMGFGEGAIALMRDAEVAPGPRDVQFAHTIQFMP
ncbi:MAG: hypothetical protein ACK4VY_01065 [Brevundimonas sp.]